MLSSTKLENLLLWILIFDIAFYSHYFFVFLDIKSIKSSKEKQKEKMVAPMNNHNEPLVKEAADPANRCRYKTGKCTNERSSKRNGQPHQLCLYHRDKANKIQRKFDRQKRLTARMKKLAARREMNPLHGASFTGLTGHEVDLFVDPSLRFSSGSERFSTDRFSSDRFSTDSESAPVFDGLWRDSGKADMLLAGVPATVIPAPLTILGNTEGHLSREEIDFLCQVMLE